MYNECDWARLERLFGHELCPRKVRTHSIGLEGGTRPNAYIRGRRLAGRGVSPFARRGDV